MTAALSDTDLRNLVDVFTSLARTDLSFGDAAAAVTQLLTERDALREHRDRPKVIVDPRQRFGQPQVAGISTDAIAGMVRAGEDIGRAAEEYDLTRHQVLLACWHEGTYGRYRRRWRTWAEQIFPKLGGHRPFDPDSEEGPEDHDG